MKVHTDHSRTDNRKHFSRAARITASLLLVLALCCGLVLPATAQVFAGADSYEVSSKRADKAEGKTDKSGKSKKKVQVKEPEIDANSFMVMSGSTSEKVFSLHADRELPIGGITKFMTAMVVIDNMYNDDEYGYNVDVTSKIADCGELFEAGESATVESMLYAMLLGNSDEAAEALAKYSATKRSIFINEMNAKAMEIGITDTQFTNPTGRYSTGHYSTAADCAVLMQYAMRYEKIKEITSTDTKSIEIRSNNKNKKNRSLMISNTNPLLSGNKKGQRYKYISGGIMSTLTEPLEYSQYAGVARKDGMQLIVVMLEAKEENVAADAIDLFDYGYGKVHRHQLVDGNKKVGKVRVRGGSRTLVPVYTECKGFAYIPPEGSTDLVDTMTVLDTDVRAPLKAASKVGELRISVAGELKGTVDLVVKDDVPEGWLPSKIYISNTAVIIVAGILLLFILFALYVISLRRKYARLREERRRQKIHEIAERQAAINADRKRRDWTYSGDSYQRSVAEKRFRETLNEDLKTRSERNKDV